MADDLKLALVVTGDTRQAVDSQTDLQNALGKTGQEIDTLGEAAGHRLPDVAEPLGEGAMGAAPKLDALNGRVRALGEESGKTSKLAAGLGGQLLQLASLQALAEFIGNAIENLREAERSFKGLESASAHAGVEIGQSFKVASGLASDGLVSLAESSQALQNLLSRGYSIDQAEQTLTRLKDAAAFNRQAHLTMGEAVVSASEGLKNENSVLVDNAGVTKNVAAMWEDYAKKIGVGVDSLTKAQKIQAEYNGIMEETEGQVGNAKKALGGLEGQLAKTSANAKAMFAAFGGDLEPAAILLSKALNFLVDDLKELFVFFNSLGAGAGAVVASLGDIERAAETLNFDGLGEKIAKNFAAADQQIAEVAKRYQLGLTPAIQQATEAENKQKEAQDKAAAAARQADEQRKDSAKQAADQAATALKLVENETKALQTQQASREAALKQQISFAEGYAKEAEGAGEHVKALTAEGEAIAKAGELKRLQIENTKALAAALDKEAEAADNLVDLLDKQAQADGLVTDKERSAISSARADAEAKQAQADAARRHLDELSRVPAALDDATRAQAAGNRITQEAYQKAADAIRASQQRRAEAAAGKATMEEAARADAEATVAVERLTEALKVHKSEAKADADMVQYRKDVSEIAARSLARERAAHDGNVEATRRAAEATRQDTEAQKSWAAQIDESASGIQGMVVETERVTRSFSESMYEAYRRSVAAATTLEQVVAYSGQFYRHIVEAQTQLQRNADAQEALNEAMQRGVGVAGALRGAQNELGRSTDNTIDEMHLLDAQHLTGLRSAIDQARAGMRALGDESRSTLAALQDELLQLQGDSAALEANQYRRKIDELRAKAEAAQSMGNQDAAANLTQAMDVEGQIHAIKMANIAKERQQAEQQKNERAMAEQRRGADAPPGAPANAGAAQPAQPAFSAPAPAAAPRAAEHVVTFEDRQARASGVFGEADAQALLGILGRHGDVSIHSASRP